MLKGSHFEVTSPTPDSPLPEDLERFPESFSPLERQTANFTYHLTDGNIATPILEEIGCESRTDDREELITIIVEIGDGREETIVVHNGDKADELAERFAMKHHLSEAMKEKLKENIQANIDEVIREMDAEEQLQEIEEMDKNPENVPEDDPEPQSEASNTGFMAKNMSQKAGNTQKSSPERKTVGSISSPKEIEVQDLTPTKGSRSALERIGLSKTPKPQNYGHKLYEKAMKVKEEREKKHEQIRKEKELEVPQWSFKPSINPVSRSMTKQAGSQSKLEDRLLQEGRRIQEKREQIKTNMTVEEQMNCPFKPEVNKNSMKLADDRSRMVSAIHSSMSVSSWGDKFEFLFEDAKRRQSHKSRLGKIVPDEECTFHPSIEISQRATVGSSSSKKLLPKNLRIEDTKVDKTTGQLLYRPKTGRAPITGRNQGKIPIGEYLYFQSKKKEKFIKALEKEESLKEKELHSKSHIQGTSKKIAENRKIGSIINIFNTLDQDSDGLISAKTVCITKLPKEILKLFTPIFCEMEELGQELNLDEFIEAACKLYENLSFPDKNTVLNYSKRTKEPLGPQPNFRPNINPKSKQMAGNSKWAKLGIAERQSLQQKIAKMKVLEQVKQKQMAEIEGCTFRPRLITPSHKLGRNSNVNSSYIL